MKKINNLEYLKLNKFNRLMYTLGNFFCSIPEALLKLGKAILNVFKKIGLKIFNIFKTIFDTFKNGSWQTRVSYLVMGFGNATRGQWLRGLFFFLFQLVFIFYMVFFGSTWLGHLFESLIITPSSP
jgi:arabinogalactan oligomer/maltooligosaccharide transport system permease protein